MTISYTVNAPRGYMGDPLRGAAMGRPPIKGDQNFTGKLSLRRVKLSWDGYDSAGTYWGHGATLLWWWASEDYKIDGTVWAPTRAAARKRVLELYPKSQVRR